MDKNNSGAHKAPKDLNNKAVSTLVGLILIIFLVVALAGIMYALIFGLVSSIEKTAYVVTDAQIFSIGQDIDGIENGLYRDTVIDVSFKDAKKSGKRTGWYDGEFTIEQNIELKRKTDE